jgi:hypothetical protein
MSGLLSHTHFCDRLQRKFPSLLPARGLRLCCRFRSERVKGSVLTIDATRSGREYFDWSGTVTKSGRGKRKALIVQSLPPTLFGRPLEVLPCYRRRFETEVHAPMESFSAIHCNVIVVSRLNLRASRIFRGCRLRSFRSRSACQPAARIPSPTIRSARRSMLSAARTDPNGMAGRSPGNRLFTLRPGWRRKALQKFVRREDGNRAPCEAGGIRADEPIHISSETLPLMRPVQAKNTSSQRKNATPPQDRSISPITTPTTRQVAPHQDLPQKIFLPVIFLPDPPSGTAERSRPVFSSSGFS